MGKTLPMLIASQLLPPGNFLWSCAYYKLQCVLSRFNDNDYRSSHHHQASAGGRLSEAWLFSSRRRPGTARLTWKCTPPPLTSPPLWAFVSQHLFLSTSQKFLRGSCWSVPQCSSSLLSSWRQPWYFQSNFQDFPKPIIKVRDTLMNVGLANNGKRPVVAIDECQVLNVN